MNTRCYREWTNTTYLGRYLCRASRSYCVQLPSLGKVLISSTLGRFHKSRTRFAGWPGARVPWVIQCIHAASLRTSTHCYHPFSLICRSRPAIGINRSFVAEHPNKTECHADLTRYTPLATSRWRTQLTVTLQHRGPRSASRNCRCSLHYSKRAILATADHTLALTVGGAGSRSGIWIPLSSCCCIHIQLLWLVVSVLYSRALLQHLFNN